AMLTPRAELEGEIGDANIGIQARLMAQVLRKVSTIVRKSEVALIFINQLREKIGTMGFGEMTTTPGGRALRHMASLRLDIRRIAQLKNGDRVVGSRLRIKVAKNKMAAPFEQVEVDFLFGEGISREAEILDLGETTGVITKTGASYSLNGTRLAHGREAARVHLQQNPELFEQLRL